MVIVMRKYKTILSIFLSIILSVITLVSSTAVSILSCGSVDEMRKADAVIVLGAGTEDGIVSPVFRGRIDHSIWLYENGYVDLIILTGGVGEGNVVSDAAAARDYALSKSVPDSVILLEESSVITEENLNNSKIIMESHGLADAIVVSDPLHMKRAMLMAKDYGLEAYSSPTPFTMYKSLKTQLPFLAREVFFYIGYCVVRLFR